MSINNQSQQFQEVKERINSTLRLVTGGQESDAVTAVSTGKQDRVNRRSWGKKSGQLKQKPQGKGLGNDKRGSATVS